MKLGEVTTESNGVLLDCWLALKVERRAMAWLGLLCPRFPCAQDTFMRSVGSKSTHGQYIVKKNMVRKR